MHDELEPRRPSPSFDSAPEVEADPAQESLVGALRASFNILRIIMIVLVVAYFFSGIFQIQPGEQGLIVRLGKLLVNEDAEGDRGETHVFEPGFNWALPDPFDEKVRLSGRAHDLPIDTFVFARAREDPDQPLSEFGTGGQSLKPGVDGAMITGDKNLAHGRWTVTYRIQDGDRFVMNIGERPEQVELLLQRLAETAIIRETSYRSIETVIQDPVVLATDVQSRLQTSLDQLNTGIRIDKVVAETIEPLGVRDAFFRATAAQNEKEAAKQRAEQTRAEILNRAAGPAHKRDVLLQKIEDYSDAQLAGAGTEQLAELRAEIDAALERAEGQVAVTLRTAKAEASQLREAVRREVEEFRYYLESYKKYPRLTVWRRWVRMRDTVLSSKQNEIFYVPPYADVLEILTNRDEAKLLEAERERYRRQMYGGADPNKR